MKNFSILLSLFLVAAFAQSQDLEVNSSAMKGVDFTKFHSYAWLPYVDSIMTNDYDKAKLDQFITEAINKELAAHGLAADSSGKPDLYIRYAIMLDRKQGTVTEAVYGKPNVGIGMGFGRGGFSGMSVGVSSPDVVGTKSKTVMYREGALVVDAIDVSANEVVWWGSASKTKEETGELVNTKMVVDEVMPKIFKKFPVKASKKK